MKWKRWLTVAVILICGILFWILLSRSREKDVVRFRHNDDAQKIIVSLFGDNAVLTNSSNEPERFLYEGELFGSQEAMEIAKKQDRLDLHGASVKMTFYVTDSRGQTVSDASVRAGFRVFEKRIEKVGKTDKNGFFVAEGETSDMVSYTVNKDGYYQTFVIHELSQRRDYNVVNNRWTPWNPTIKVTLKEKRNPIPMYVKQNEIKIPEWDKPVGYDFKKGDWVKPYGEGEETDIEFVYTEDRSHSAEYTFNLNLLMRFPKEHDGAYLKKRDTFSSFHSEYTVLDNIFQQQFDFRKEATNGVFHQYTKLNENEYLAFRVRSKTNMASKVISAQYGKIYHLDYGIGKERRIRFRYYFNPNENDRNIEFATGQNLFGRKEFNSEP